MIESLGVQNFTIVSKRENFYFAEGINVVIGENASGKSHLLKLAYTLAAISREAAATIPGKADFERMIGRKLLRIFRPKTLGRLVHRGANEADVSIGFTQKACSYDFSFTSRSRSDVKLHRPPDAFLSASAVFLPTREILSLWPGFESLYQRHDMGFDATYFDLARALKTSPLPDATVEKFQRPLQRLEELVGGCLHLESGRFLLQTGKEESLEIDLVAEGIRKLATLGRLIRNGSIHRGSLLFWDEPETNLNPRLIRPLAEILMELSQQGVQIFLATHSLFLLRELEILSQHERYRELPQHYITFSLKGGEVSVSQGERIEEAEPIVSLDESLEQSDRYLEME